jgi:branched-chain amino acid transport system permease protein
MTARVQRVNGVARNPFSGMDRKRRDVVIVGILLAIALIYPHIYRDLARSFGFIPWPDVTVLIVCCIFGILALGLNIVMGFAGLLDLGYVAFYAIGAYTTAFLASGHFDIHIIWWLVVWVAVAAAALWGILLGAPTLKLRGDYLAIVTLGFGEIVRLVFRNLGDFTLALPAILGGAVLIGPHANLTGGNVGINPIDPPIIPLPGGGQIAFSNQNPVASFYLVIALLCLTFFFCVRLRDSRLGRAWMAIREDETAAAAMGINTVTTKLLAFSLGASFSGFAGAFIGSYQTAIFAETFNFNVSILVVIIIILGGIGSLRGVVAGAFLVVFIDRTLLVFLGENVLNEPIQALGQATGIELLRNFVLHTYNFLIFGIILVIMMIVRPEGLFPVEHARAEMHGVGVAAESAMATADELAEAETDLALQSEEATEAILPPTEERDESGDFPLEGERDPASGAEAALGADTPPSQVRDRDLPEDTR